MDSFVTLFVACGIMKLVVFITCILLLIKMTCQSNEDFKPAVQINQKAFLAKGVLVNPKPVEFQRYVVHKRREAGHVILFDADIKFNKMDIFSCTINMFRTKTARYLNIYVMSEETYNALASAKSEMKMHLYNKGLGGLINL